MDGRRIGGFILMGLGGLGLAFLAAAALWSLPEAMAGASWIDLALAAIFPVAFLLVGRRLAFPQARVEVLRPPRASPLPPVPAPGAEAVADLPLPVTACPDCGFLGVRMPQLEDGVWLGGGELGDRRVCPRCGYQGLVPSFPTGDDYASFVRRLNLTWDASAHRR